MAKETNILKSIKARMKELQDAKAEQLETIQQKLEEARTQIDAADQSIKAATEQMNVDAYEKAQSEKHRAKIARDMYEGRLKQLEHQDLISEEDSDKVIDSLLEYEDKLAEDYQREIVSVLRELAKIHRTYREEVSETENVLTAWQNNIHANYSTRGKALYHDEITGKYTDRSSAPVKVHNTPYLGCGESNVIDEFLDKSKVSELIKSDEE